MDLKIVFEKLPPSYTAFFYESSFFNDLLTGDLETLKKFLKDIQDTNVEDFMNHFASTPKLLEAWEGFIDNLDLRKNIDLLNYVANNLDELDFIKRSLKEVSDKNVLILNLSNRPFIHIPTSGVVIYSKLQQGTYLIGGFPSDLQHVLTQLNYPKMDPLDLSYPIPNGQRFNLLNVSDEVYAIYQNAEVGFFRSVNGPWIDLGVAQKVPIITISDVNQYLYRLENGVQVLTGYGKEVHRLEWIHNYRYDPVTKRMLPPDEAIGLPTLTNQSEYNHGL